MRRSHSIRGTLFVAALCLVAASARADDGETARRLVREALRAEAADGDWARAAELYRKALDDPSLPSGLGAGAGRRLSRCAEMVRRAAEAPAPVSSASAGETSLQAVLEDGVERAARAFVAKAGALTLPAATPRGQTGRVVCWLARVRDESGRCPDLDALRGKAASVLEGVASLDLVLPAPGGLGAPEPTHVVWLELLTPWNTESADSAQVLDVQLALVAVEAAEPILAASEAVRLPAVRAASTPEVGAAAVASESVHRPFRDKECASCHVPASSIPKGQPRREVWDRCVECHADKADRSAPGNACTKHPIGLACDAGRVRQGRELPLPGGRFECVTCHEHHRSKFAHLLRDGPQGLCRRCHEK